MTIAPSHRSDAVASDPGRRRPTASGRVTASRGLFAPAVVTPIVTAYLWRNLLGPDGAVNSLLGGALSKAATPPATCRSPFPAGGTTSP